MTLDGRRDRWSLAWLFVLAALLLGFAIQLDFGTLSNGSIVLLTLALLACIAGVVAPDWRAIGERNVAFALGAALVVEIGMLLVWPPGAGGALQDAGTLVPFRLAIVASGVSGLAALFVRHHRGWWAGVAVAGYLVCGLWVIALSPNPPNDVWHFQQAASHALLAGQNPYAVAMPNIYGPGSGLYAPALEHGDLLDFGFLYPPLSLILVLPGMVFGDVRFALLAAAALAAVLIMGSRPGRVAVGAGLLFLFTPRTFFVVEQAWTEPLAIMLLALTVFLATRDSRLTPLGLGLGTAVKQHLLLVLPLGLLLVPSPIQWRRLRRPGTVALGAAALVTLPLAAWNAAAFWHSVVVVQFLQPARPDALAYPAWLVPDLPGVAAVAGFIALVPAMGLAVWRAPRTPAGFAAAVALVYLAFFAFSKQAFANYYFFVIGALCVAVAATTAPPVHDRAQ